MSTFYPQYPVYPVALNEWSPIISVAPIYTVPMVPIPVIGNPVLSSQICPYVSPVVIPPMLPSPMFLSSEASPVSTTSYDESFSSEESPILSVDSAEIEDRFEIEKDPIEFYLLLPKELFPSARMMTIDPNPIIEEFCKMLNVDNHAPWILDLEFGIPKTPITRHIPTYDVKFNSIHCKNTPDAIHPGFESCSQDFKRVLLFYYDCIVSAWYRGFIMLKCDKSVENFQSWLLPPMQVLGMCWP